MNFNLIQSGNLLVAKVLLASAMGICSQQALAQPFSIDRFVIAGGGNSSGGGVFALSSTVGQSATGRMNDSRYVVEGGFWNVLAPNSPAAESITIFDNSSGSFSGQGSADPNVWQASKFCVGPQAFTLDSVALFLASRDLGNPPVVRLLIYSDDPVTGKPSASTGLAMNLSGETNPIVLTAVGGSTRRPVTWIPATPFVLLPNRCYWAVLVVESGEVLLTSTPLMPTGAAGAFGSADSFNAGVTWGAGDSTSNRKMLIKGTATTVREEFQISLVSFTASELGFRFSGNPGQRFVIESRTDFTSGAWVEVPGTTRTGDGTVQQVTISNAFQRQQQFYRVKLLP